MSQYRSNKKFLIGIAVAVLLPLSFYLVVNELSKGKVVVPGQYGNYKVDSHMVKGAMQYDTTYLPVEDLILTNQLGEQVSINKDLAGKSVVINFMFTSCNTICPKLTENMKMLQISFKKDPRKEASLDTVLQLISITVDPEHDSVSVLRTYADAHGVNHDRWWFLTGDKKTIYNYARNVLKLRIGPGDGGSEDFIHTDKFVLIDRDRIIRGYYNGLNDTEANKCANDIVLLNMEKKHKK